MKQKVKIDKTREKNDSDSADDSKGSYSDHNDILTLKGKNWR